MIYYWRDTMSIETKIRQSSEYKIWIKELKQKLRRSQVKAAIKVNSVLLEFYWELGIDIVEKQKRSSWGSGFLKQLSKDLMDEFPDMKGFSEVNLSFIRRWVRFYIGDFDNSVTGCDEIVKDQISVLFQIPWGHNREIISKCNIKEKALFYVKKTIENGWSRSVLTHQIESKLYERNGKALTNFSHTLPKPQSDLANELIKDPYSFDFLTLTENFREKELELALLDNITKFLLELGSGFAFVGKQKNLKVGDRDFYIDLLFYHTQMHCYVVVELKVVDFEPEFAGKLNFYIKAVDEQIKTDKDEPTIGILLCKSKDKMVVEYSLSDIHKPIGVSEYQLTHKLPDKLRLVLPSIEEIEAELTKADQ